MPRKGENIYKRKDGRWEGRYIKARSKTGKAVYGYVYAPTYKEAKRKRSQAIINIEANQTTICKVSETTMSTTQCSGCKFQIPPPHRKPVLWLHRPKANVLSVQFQFQTV